MDKAILVIVVLIFVGALGYAIGWGHRGGRS
jgi:hypothetical protein